MSSARISRWARRFLLVSAAWFVLSQVAVLTAVPRRAEIFLGLYGFVLTTVFGKAYSLVPSYFDRTLAWTYAPAVQLPLSTGGVAALALGGAGVGPTWLSAAGALAWVAGVAVFLGTMLVTIGGNLTGAETGTGDANADRRGLDRLANAFVPVVFGYLLVGCLELLAGEVGTPSLFGGLAVRTTHLLVAGVALLLLFSVGYRLLPRFLVVYPSRRLAAIVLTFGTLGPALLAWGYPAGTVFQVGAVLQSIAVVGFAGAYLRMLSRTERDRVGLYSVAVAVVLGCLGVALGTHFAFAGLDAELATAHRHVNVYGLLGLSIVGAVYQFYPPAVCPWPGGNDRTALATIALVATGLLVVAATSVIAPAARAVGHALVLSGAGGYAYILAGTIRYQTSNWR
ncbi:hypothetical protein [Salinibaculum salinum]|uniref:hypothetical protein n=1 Tax=Salinibaculum salinum TaxID=3131996 RepID=UPI0030EBB362